MKLDEAKFWLREHNREIEADYGDRSTALAIMITLKPFPPAAAWQAGQEVPFWDYWERFGWIHSAALTIVITL